MAEKESKRKERKQQLTIWVKPSTMMQIDALKEADNCESKSEFIEKALQFYFGYLSCKSKNSYLPNALTSTMRSIVAETINQQNTILFKIAVELGIIENLIAKYYNVDEILLQRLRGYCVEEVKRTNGILSFEDIVKSLR